MCELPLFFCKEVGKVRDGLSLKLECFKSENLVRKLELLIHLGDRCLPNWETSTSQFVKGKRRYERKLLIEKLGFSNCPRIFSVNHLSEGEQLRLPFCHLWSFSCAELFTYPLQILIISRNVVVGRINWHIDWDIKLKSWETDKPL